MGCPFNTKTIRLHGADISDNDDNIVFTSTKRVHVKAQVSLASLTSCCTSTHLLIRRRVIWNGHDYSEKNTHPHFTSNLKSFRISCPRLVFNLSGPERKCTRIVKTACRGELSQPRNPLYSLCHPLHGQLLLALLFVCCFLGRIQLPFDCGGEVVACVRNLFIEFD